MCGSLEYSGSTREDKISMCTLVGEASKRDGSLRETIFPSYKPEGNNRMHLCPNAVTRFVFVLRRAPWCVKAERRKTTCQIWVITSFGNADKSFIYFNCLLIALCFEKLLGDSRQDFRIPVGRVWYRHIPRSAPLVALLPVQLKGADVVLRRRKQSFKRVECKPDRPSCMTSKLQKPYQKKTKIVLT